MMLIDLCDVIPGESSHHKAHGGKELCDSTEQQTSTRIGKENSHRIIVILSDYSLQFSTSTLNS